MLAARVFYGLVLRYAMLCYACNAICFNQLSCNADEWTDVYV